jgi:hypothetical protein
MGVRISSWLGAYLAEKAHFRPNGVVGFVTCDYLRGFADTSGNDVETDMLLTVNGCLSTCDKWAQFDIQWQEYLKAEHFKPDDETGKYVFHATEFHTGNYELMPGKKHSRFDRERIYWNLIGLIKKHTLYRFGWGVYLGDLRQLEQDFPHVREAHYRQQTGTWLSKMCFTHNSWWAQENGFDFSIDYVFDRGDHFWGELYDEHRQARHKAPKSERLIVAGLADGNKAEYSPLQAADILAWECRNYFLSFSKDHLDGLKPAPRPDGHWRRLLVEGECELFCRGYKHLHSDITEDTEQAMEHVYSKDVELAKDMYFGEDGMYESVDELTRERLAIRKEKRDKEKQALLDNMYAKRASKDRSKGSK